MEEVVYCSVEVILPPGCCLVTLGNGVISRTQCWSLLLVYLVLSSSKSHISLSKWKSVLLSPCINSVSANLVLLFIGLLTVLEMAREIDCSQMDHPISFHTELVLC